MDVNRGGGGGGERTIIVAGSRWRGGGGGGVAVTRQRSRHWHWHWHWHSGRRLWRRHQSQCVQELDSQGADLRDGLVVVDGVHHSVRSVPGACSRLQQQRPHLPPHRAQLRVAVAVALQAVGELRDGGEAVFERAHRRHARAHGVKPWRRISWEAWRRVCWCWCWCACACVGTVGRGCQR